MDSAVTGSPETSVHLFAGDAACSSEMNSEINNLQNYRIQIVSSMRVSKISIYLLYLEE